MDQQSPEKEEGPAMTDSITPGTKVGNWQVLGVDGKRAHCACSCGTVRVLAVTSLLDGSCAPSCGCAPLSPTQLAQQRGEAERQQQLRELRGWRPQT
jgi:hypothetical protein